MTNLSLSEKDKAEAISLCARMYDAVGWNKDKSPNWDVFRETFHQDAILAPVSSGSISTIKLEDFIPMMTNQRDTGALVDFKEWEIARSVEGFGNMAFVRSTFVANMDGNERRGVTYALVVKDEGRWKILSTIWDNEEEGKPLPDDYLKDTKR